ncbi:MAG: hypothetical protein IKF39_05230 [Oscillospiraceae bacterium]|nr:hypothetical protein [Oscillospiraceae bacterium]
MEHFEKEIERKLWLSKEDLVEHLKCIGQTIIDDAEAIGAKPQRTCYIAISAAINPETEMTKIDYRIERLADPRIEKAVCFLEDESK